MVFSWQGSPVPRELDGQGMCSEEAQVDVGIRDGQELSAEGPGFWRLLSCEQSLLQLFLLLKLLQRGVYSA